MTKRVYNWFIEPLGDVSRANEVIARELDEPTDNTRSIEIDVPCADGKKHSFWNCSGEMAQKLWKSRASLKIEIRIWIKEGGGLPRDAAYLFKSTARKKADQLLAQLKQKATK